MSADPFRQGFDPETGERVEQLMVSELWAWVSLDPADGSEGVLAVNAGGVWMPLVGADRNRIESYRAFALEAQKHMPNPIELRRFGQMQVIESLQP
jgi:hypothetical protein